MNRGILTGGLMLLLAACGSAELHGKLTESQANEMIAALQNAGIDAAKQSQGEEGWSITTAQGDFARSVEVLRAQGLPRERFADLGSVFKKEGFVSSPTEERARLVYGLSQELSRTVSEIDGVVQARVHLAIPEPDPLRQVDKPSSASVFIKHRPGVALDRQIGQIKALVVNSIEGLKYDNVTVVMFPTQPLPAAIPRGTGDRMLSSLGQLVPVAVLGVGAFLGWPLFRRWQMRRQALRQTP